VIGGALAAMLRLTLADGREVRVHAKDDWRTQLGAPDDWKAEAFDDATWPKAVPARVVPPCHPWVTGPAVQLRRAFRLDKPVARARLYATALGGYEARLNGRKVGDGVLAPESTDFRTRALYRTYDVADLVRAATTCWARSSPTAGSAARSASWTCATRSARRRAGSRPCWTSSIRTARAPGSRPTARAGAWPAPIVLSEIYDGETYDARLEQSGWDAPGFDDRGWTAARVGETPPCRLAAHAAPPIRAIQTLKPFGRPASRRPRRPHPRLRPELQRLVPDPGQGTGRRDRPAALRRGPAADGTLNTTSNRRALQTDTYILRGDPAGETFEPRFTFHGFRYVEVTGWPGAFSPDAVEGVVLHSDAALSGAARIDNPLIQAICGATPCGASAATSWACPPTARSATSAWAGPATPRSSGTRRPSTWTSTPSPGGSWATSGPASRRPARCPTPRPSGPWARTRPAGPTRRSSCPGPSGGAMATRP
jgi:alpha-L-rhamnosidase